MAVNNYKDKGSIIKFGGGTLKVREISDTGAPISASISAISKAATAVVTVVSGISNFANGDSVIIFDAAGMTEVNGIIFTVANINTGAGTFELSGINSTGYGVYTTETGTVEIANNWDLGYINDSGLRFETAVEEIQDESGSVVASNEGNDTVKLEGLFMQSNKSLLDFLRDNTRGEFYEVYYKMSPTAQLNGLTQELFIGVAKIKRMIDVKANTKRIPYEFTILKNDAAITINYPAIIFGSVKTADVTITAEKYYQIEEN